MWGWTCDATAADGCASTLCAYFLFLTGVRPCGVARNTGKRRTSGHRSRVRLERVALVTASEGGVTDVRRAVRLKLPHGRREFHDGPLAARAAPNLSYGANVLRVSGRPLREPPHAFGVRWEPYDLVLLRPSSHGSHGSLGFIGKARTISRPRVTRPASMPDTRCCTSRNCMVRSRSVGGR